MNRQTRFPEQLEIVRIGDAAGVILPKEVLERLQLEIGDKLSVGEMPNGVTLSTDDPEYERQMASARSIMKRYHNALSELAK